MQKMWAGRASGETAAIADDFDSSIRFDQRMYKQDIQGSMAHVTMLEKQKILSSADVSAIKEGLQSILADIESGALQIDPTAEDIHMFMEATLTARIGEAGKKVHTARARNDQTSVDHRLYLRELVDDTIANLKNTISTITDIAEKHKETVIPGYTHMQRAQPISYGYYMCAWAFMLSRDVERLQDARKRLNICPLGSCAMSGTTYNTDRQYTAQLLGFDSACLNSMDGVSDRDYVVEILCALSLIMTHLSRFAEEILLYTNWEYKFLTLDDAFTTGSSQMPQKKNSDMAELIRGKSGRVIGELVAMLTVLKGTPFTYNKDFQEDKEGVFDAFDTVKICLDVFTPMIATMTVHTDRMLEAAKEGFINATDMADYMVGKGMAFRNAYGIVGSIVRDCVKSGKTFETMTLDEYKTYWDGFDSDVYEAIDLTNCMKRRKSYGATAPEEVDRQIAFLREFVK